jgi:hypothetical protein
MKKTSLTRLEAVKDLVQEAIDKGASSVQQIHQTIADLPLAALERSGLLGEAGSKARAAHERTLNDVYDAIRRVNSEVGALVTGLFETLEDHSDAQANLGRPSSEELKGALDDVYEKEKAVIKGGGKKRKAPARRK